MDNEVDRFSLYIICQLKAAVQNKRMIKEIGLSTRRLSRLQTYNQSRRRTADHAVKVAENVSTLKTPFDTVLFKQISSMSTSAIRGTAEYASDIAEIVLNMTIDHVIENTNLVRIL
jgi:phosphate uptake regulator